MMCWFACSLAFATKSRDKAIESSTMSLEAAVRNVGLDVALRQAGFVHQPSRQSMADSDATKVEKIRLSFSNHPIWEKTANARITKEKRGEGEVYRIDFLYQNHRGVKSKKFKHGKRHATVQEAEGAMFDVRMSKESKKAKVAIMALLRGDTELEPMPKKVSSVASAGPTRKKVKATMKYGHAARKSRRPNRNPNGPGDLSAEALANRYGGSTNWVELIQREIGTSLISLCNLRTFATLCLHYFHIPMMRPNASTS